MLMLAALAPAAARGIGAALAAGDRETAESLRLQAMADLNIKLPELTKLEAQFQNDTELKKVMADPRYSGAQDSALNRMGQYSTEGMTDQDIAAIESAKREAANVESGVLGRNRQAMAARGISGSGIDLANQMAASQGAVDRAYAGGMKMASDAADRRMRATLQNGDFASRLGENDLAHKERVAGAQDRINEFNTSDQRHVRDSNRADEKWLYGQQWDQAKAKSGLDLTRSGAADDAADRTEGTISDIGEGVSNVAAGTDEALAAKKKRKQY
jgi:hypothetical protein